MTKKEERRGGREVTQRRARGLVDIAGWKNSTARNKKKGRIMKPHKDRTLPPKRSWGERWESWRTQEKCAPKKERKVGETTGY